VDFRPGLEGLLTNLGTVAHGKLDITVADHGVADRRRRAKPLVLGGLGLPQLVGAALLRPLGGFRRLHQRHDIPHIHNRSANPAAIAGLTTRQIDLSGRVVVFESLKKRRRGVSATVPVPPELLDALDMVHGIREAQRRGQVQALLWPWSRMTGFRRVQEVIAAAGIPDGPHACPKGCGTASACRRSAGTSR
jgi:hypothetical protein